MALVLNEEQNMLREAAAGFLAEHATVSHLRALRDANDGQGFDPAVWREMAAMGWAGIAIAEEYGGLGYGYTGLGLVLEQAGRHLSASPLESTVLLGATAIGELGNEVQKAAWLPAIAAGEKIVTLALQEGAHHAPLRTALSARAEGDGYLLEGTKTLVLDASIADAFVVIARTGEAAGSGEGLSAFLVRADASGLRVDRRSMVDSRSADCLVLDRVTVGADALMGDAGSAWAGLERTLDIACIGVAAQLLGLATEAFERTLAYIRERRQFGQPIGAFQGLQHRAAILYAELELARSIVLQALHAVDSDSEALARLASAAKAKLCAVAELATNEGIQMHGGVGMTDEYDIGFFLKRARVLQHLLGDQNFHLDRYARLSGY